MMGDIWEEKRKKIRAELGTFQRGLREKLEISDFLRIIGGVFSFVGSCKY